MNKTSIQWTDLSANPLKYRRKGDGKVVWACVKTSPGCAHCYSEAIALRYDRGKVFNAATMEELEPFLDEAELRKMLTAKTVGGVKVSGSKCFVGDMTDLFGAWVPDELLDRLFAVFALRQDVVFQVLTKRSERMRDYLLTVQNDDKDLQRFANVAAELAGSPCASGIFDEIAWPPPNVWLGCSVEDQQRTERIELLLATPAAVRFVSFEPLLGPVEAVQHFSTGGYRNYLTGQFHDIRCKGVDGNPDFTVRTDDPRLPQVSWAIIGGESGPGSRPCDVAWLRSLLKQCKMAGVPAFMKQAGANVLDHDTSSAETFPMEQCWPSGTRTDGSRVLLRDSKGGDLDELPEDLRVRQWPEGVTCG